MREKLASRIGFIFLSAGCAIGLGNVWRFPYMVGQNGGGWFVAIYLLCLAIIGFPIMLMEFASGRASQKSISLLHRALTPDKRIWGIHGAFGIIGNTCLMMFYTTVTGWMLIYFFRSMSGMFKDMDHVAIGEAFGATLGDPVIMMLAMLAVCAIATIVCAIGLQKGVERVTKWMMLCLFALIIVLAVHSLMLDGAIEGVKFYLIPDFAKTREIGVAKVIVEAMNHSFFTLSLGIGAMAIFGSYIGRNQTLVGEAMYVGILDTVVAIFAGLIIIPACFAYHVEPGQGPGLIFVTLPNVFNNMAFGRLWGSLFFLFMSFAAMTTVIAVFETILACLRDYTGWSRGRACAVMAFAIPVLSLPCLLGFNVLSAIHPLGGESGILDLEDFIVSNLLLPLGGLAFAIYCTSRYGWGWKRFRDEVNAGDGIKIADNAILRGYCAYVLPVIVFAIFIIGLVDRFGG